jgi:hypothetical protein
MLGVTKWFTDNSLSIGRTPLVRLNRVVGDTRAIVLAKIEGRNPAYSVKCRIGAALIWDAELIPKGKPFSLFGTSVGCRKKPMSRLFPTTPCPSAFSRPLCASKLISLVSCHQFNLQ